MDRGTKRSPCSCILYTTDTRWRISRPPIHRHPVGIIVTLLCGAYLSATVGEQVLSPLFPTTRHDLGLSEGQGGIAFGVLAFSIAAFNMVSGLALARWAATTLVKATRDGDRPSAACWRRRRTASASCWSPRSCSVRAPDFSSRPACSAWRCSPGPTGVGSPWGSSAWRSASGSPVAALVRRRRRLDRVAGAVLDLHRGWRWPHCSPSRRCGRPAPTVRVVLDAVAGGARAADDRRHGRRRAAVRGAGVLRHVRGRRVGPLGGPGGDGARHRPGGLDPRQDRRWCQHRSHRVPAPASCAPGCCSASPARRRVVAPANLLTYAVAAVFAGTVELASSPPPT